MEYLTIIFNVVLKVLKSKYFWIGLTVLIAIILIRRYWNEIIDKIKPIHGDFTDDLTDADKKSLENLAKQLRDVIYGNYAFENRGEVLHKCNALNDTEFLYLVRYYNRYLGDVAADVDNEWMPASNEDELFLSRLNGMGL